MGLDSTIVETQFGTLPTDLASKITQSDFLALVRFSKRTIFGD